MKRWSKIRALSQNPRERRSRQERASIAGSRQPGSGEVLVDLSPFLTQPVKTRSSANGELSHGIVTQEVHKRVQVGGGQAA